MQNLTTELKKRLKASKRIAILGVGSELRGDDAAGMLVAGAVLKKIYLPKGMAKKIKVFLGATAPENLTGEIIRFKPSHIIIVDTADIKEKPGTVLLLNAEDLAEGVSFSTHKLPPKVMMDYLVKLLKCRIFVIGIQPKTLKFDASVSKEVKSSVKEVSDAIISAVKSRA